MAADLKYVLALGEIVLTAYEKYLEGRAEMADASDDSVAELDAKLEAIFDRIALKKQAADEALAEAAKRS